MEITSDNFTVANLGECTIKSPLHYSTKHNDYIANFTEDCTRIIYNNEITCGAVDSSFTPVLIEEAGARKQIFFDPKEVHAAVVTCGGLCPGLNNVIRTLVLTLRYQYGVDKVTGIKYGFKGLIEKYGIDPIDLTAESVKHIHRRGGTFLGSSRGHGKETIAMVDRMEKLGINMLFTVGGDGTQRGANAIYKECERRGLKISVIGIPKTIDNDISFVRKSFGFETAVEKASEAVTSAFVEASGADNGIGIVKVMGRESGYIAAHAALATNNANFVLVPEVPFDLDGENGFFAALEKRIAKKGRAVIIVAEGAGQEMLKNFEERYADHDASGNKNLGDIGTFMRDQIISHFDGTPTEVSVKYIDPSYIIRSQPANANDSIYCARLSADAVHAAMAGKTGMLLGLVHSYYVHIPIEMAVSRRNVIDPNSDMWRSVLEVTGMPALMQ